MGGEQIMEVGSAVVGTSVSLGVGDGMGVEEAVGGMLGVAV
jgi:hypothetical protein